MDYDVVYIGSGNAAWQGGRFLRKAGLKILIIEESLYGGACANRGCNSKALLDAPYEIKALADNFEGVGKKGDFEVDWPALMKYKQKRIAGMSIFLDGKFDEYDLDVAHGKGVIVDEHTVKVGEKTFTTDKIVICTGLKQVIPDIKGKEYLKTQNKYYAADMGLRNAAIHYRQHEITHIIENVVYLELLRRGYLVDIGKNREKEIDFIAKDLSGISYYIQVSYTIQDAAVRAREISAFYHLDDGYKKILITMDRNPLTNLENGYRMLHLFDFLLNDRALETV